MCRMTEVPYTCRMMEVPNVSCITGLPYVLHDGGTIYLAWRRCLIRHVTAMSYITEVPHMSYYDGDVLYDGDTVYVIYDGWGPVVIIIIMRLGLDERRTFDVETEVVELRSNGSSDWIVVPQLVVVSMLMPRKDPRSRGGAGSLDVQHQSTQTTLYQVELTTQQPHVQQRQQVNNRSSVTITAFATSICSFPTETISK